MFVTREAEKLYSNSFCYFWDCAVRILYHHKLAPLRSCSLMESATARLVAAVAASTTPPRRRAAVESLTAHLSSVSSEEKVTFEAAQLYTLLDAALSPHDAAPHRGYRHAARQVRDPRSRRGVCIGCVIRGGSPSSESARYDRLLRTHTRSLSKKGREIKRIGSNDCLLAGGRVETSTGKI